MIEELDFIKVIFQIVVLVMSAVAHEVSHGFMAYRLGDSTAKDAGRLTLNPLKHLDLYGSLIVPLVMYIGTFGSFSLLGQSPCRIIRIILKIRLVMPPKWLWPDQR